MLARTAAAVFSSFLLRFFFVSSWFLLRSRSLATIHRSLPTVVYATRTCLTMIDDDSLLLLSSSSEHADDGVCRLVPGITNAAFGPTYMNMLMIMLMLLVVPPTTRMRRRSPAAAAVVVVLRSIHRSLWRLLHLLSPLAVFSFIIINHHHHPRRVFSSSQVPRAPAAPHAGGCAAAGSCVLAAV